MTDSEVTEAEGLAAEAFDSGPIKDKRDIRPIRPGFPTKSRLKSDRAQAEKNPPSDPFVPACGSRFQRHHGFHFFDGTNFFTHQFYQGKAISDGHRYADYEKRVMHLEKRIKAVKRSEREKYKGQERLLL